MRREGDKEGTVNRVLGGRRGTKKARGMHKKTRILHYLAGGRKMRGGEANSSNA